MPATLSISSCTLGSNGHTITVAIGGIGLGPLSGGNGFKIVIGGIQYTPVSKSISSSNVLLESGFGITSAETVTINYTPGDLQDSLGNTMASSTGNACTNSSALSSISVFPNDSSKVVLGIINTLGGSGGDFLYMGTATHYVIGFQGTDFIVNFYTNNALGKLLYSIDGGAYSSAIYKITSGTPSAFGDTGTYSIGAGILSDGYHYIDIVNNSGGDCVNGPYLMGVTGSSPATAVPPTTDWSSNIVQMPSSGSLPNYILFEGGAGWDHAGNGHQQFASPINFGGYGGNCTTFRFVVPAGTTKVRTLFTNVDSTSYFIPRIDGVDGAIISQTDMTPNINVHTLTVNPATSHTIQYDFMDNNSGFTPGVTAIMTIGAAMTTTPLALRDYAIFDGDSITQNVHGSWASTHNYPRTVTRLSSVRGGEHYAYTNIAIGGSYLARRTLNYKFTVSGVTTWPSIGATYTNNTKTFTVIGRSNTGSAGSIFATATGAPAASGTLTRASGTGDATISFSGQAQVDTNGCNDVTAGGGKGAIMDQVFSSLPYAAQVTRYSLLAGTNNFADWNDQYGDNGGAYPNDLTNERAYMGTQLQSLLDRIFTAFGANTGFECDILTILPRVALAGRGNPSVFVGVGQNLDTDIGALDPWNVALQTAVTAWKVANPTFTTKVRVIPTTIAQGYASDWILTLNSDTPPHYADTLSQTIGDGLHPNITGHDHISALYGLNWEFTQTGKHPHSLMTGGIQDLTGAIYG